MPQVYENLYLNEGNFNAYNFATKSGNKECTIHPSIEEHNEIADKLIPFLKDLLILK